VWPTSAVTWPLSELKRKLLTARNRGDVRSGQNSRWRTTVKKYPPSRRFPNSPSTHETRAVHIDDVRQHVARPTKTYNDECLIERLGQRAPREAFIEATALLAAW